MKAAPKVPRYLAVANHFESLILSGELNHGDRLPPTAEVARLFDVTVPTVQQGLAFLAEKGLLKRVRKMGTVVDASPCAKTVALLIGANPFEIESQYPRLFVAAMDRLAKQDGISLDCHFSLGGGDFAHRSRRLREDAKAGRYSGLVAVHGSDEIDALATITARHPLHLPGDRQRLRQGRPRRRLLPSGQRVPARRLRLDVHAQRQLRPGGGTGIRGGLQGLRQPRPPLRPGGDALLGQQLRERPRTGLEAAQTQGSPARRPFSSTTTCSPEASSRRSTSWT